MVASILGGNWYSNMFDILLWILKCFRGAEYINALEMGVDLMQCVFEGGVVRAARVKVPIL